MKGKHRYSAAVLGLLLAVLLLAIPASAAAKTNLYINYAAATLKATSNGVLEVTYQVRAPREMDSIGAVKIEFFVMENGYWEPDGAIYSSFHEGMLERDQDYYTNTVPYTGTIGQKYYAIVTAYAADETGSGYEYANTNAVTAQ